MRERSSNSKFHGARVGDKTQSWSQFLFPSFSLFHTGSLRCSLFESTALQCRQECRHKVFFVFRRVSLAVRINDFQKSEMLVGAIHCIYVVTVPWQSTNIQASPGNRTYKKLVGNCITKSGGKRESLPQFLRSSNRRGDMTVPVCFCPSILTDGSK